MKYRTKLLVAVGIICSTTSVAAVAQSTTTEPGAGYVTQQNDDDFPWGLLGLLGLAGFIGLKRKDEDRDFRRAS